MSHVTGAEGTQAAIRVKLHTLMKFLFMTVSFISLGADTLTFEDGRKLENVVVLPGVDTLTVRDCSGKVQKISKTLHPHWQRSTVKCSPESGKQKKDENQTERVLLGVVPSELRSLTLSADLRRYAYRITENGKAWIVLDGVQQTPTEDKDPQFDFSPDGRRFAYTGASSGKQFIILDGKKQDSHDYLGLFTFSPDSKRFAYSAERKFWVVDGKRQPPLESLAIESQFSPDSKRFAYGGQRNKKRGDGALIIDGEITSMPGLFDGMVFSPDSKRIAYDFIPNEGGGNILVLDGTPQPIRVHSYLTVNFSADSKRVSYQTYDSGFFAVVDGKKQEYQIEEGSIIFSPDSERFGYVGQRDGARFAVIDGVKQAEYRRVYRPIFSPDGKHFAYTAEDNAYSRILVRDGVSRKVNHYGDLIYSPDSNHLIYVYASASGANTSVERLMIDDVEVAHARKIVQPIRFDTNGKALLYGSVDENNKLWRNKLMLN